MNNSENTQTTLRERVEQFLATEKITNSEFARLLDVSNAFVNSIKQNIGVDKLEKMKAINPRLNINWLLFNEGSMYTDDSELKELRTEVTQLREKVTLQQRIIDLLDQHKNA